MPSPQVLRAKGLYLDESQVGSAPEGALTIADNVVIVRDGVIQPRKGMRAYCGTPTGISPYLPVLTLVEYLGTALAISVGGGGLYRIMPSGAYGSESASPVLISGAFAAAGLGFAKQFLRSLFLCGSAGIQWMETATATSVSTPGVPRCGDCTSSGQSSGGSYDWLPDLSAVAYRACLIKRSANDVLMSGSPGGYLQVTNTSGNKTTVSVKVTLPPNLGLTTSHYIQLYRTLSVTGTASTNIPAPGEEMYLVNEYQITSTDLVNQFASLTDVTPNSAVGTTAYWSPSQGGILNSNEQPPLATDLDVFRQYLLASNTKQKQRLILRLLASGRGGINVGDVVQLSQPTGGTISLIAGTTDSGATFSVQGPLTTYNNAAYGGSTGADIAQTARNLRDAINRSTSYWSAYYLESGDDPTTVGQLLIESNKIGDAIQFAACPLANAVAITSQVRSGSVVTVTTSASHNYTTGMNFTLVGSGSALFVAGNKGPIVILSATTFSYAEAGTGGTFASAGYSGRHTDPGAAWSPSMISGVANFDDSAKKNRLCYSKPGAGYAFTLTGYLDVAGEEYAITKLQQLGDSVFIFKERGLYRLTGTDPSNFRIDLFDASVDLTDPKSVQVLDGVIYCLTTNGVIALTEGGKQIISRPIETALFQSMIAESKNSVTAGRAFGVISSKDHLYILGVPIASEDAGGGNFVPSAWDNWVYCSYEKAWTKRTDQFSHGICLPDGRLVTSQHRSTGFFQPQSTVYPALAYIERRGYEASDYSDNSFPQALDQGTAAAIGDIAVNCGDALAAVPGDTIVIANEQYKLIDVDDAVLYTDGPIRVAAPIGTNFTAYRHIPVAVEYSTLTAGIPARVKDFRQVTLLLRDGYFSKLYLGFATDYVPVPDSVAIDIFTGFYGFIAPSTVINGEWSRAFSGLTTYRATPGDPRPSSLGAGGSIVGSNRVNRALVTSNHRRGTRLYVGLICPVALENLSIEGVVVDVSDSTSERGPGG